MLQAGQEVVFKWYSRPEEDLEDEKERTLICAKSSEADCSQEINAQVNNYYLELL